MPWASMVFRAGAVAKPTDSRNAARADADIAGIPGRAGAIDDMPVADHQIVALLREHTSKRHQQ